MPGRDPTAAAAPAGSRVIAETTRVRPRARREAGSELSAYRRSMRSGERHYDILLKPQTADIEGHPVHGPVLRVMSVEATGSLGESGYPRYAGEGVEADIDPRTRTVEAVTVDGEELPYGWVALIADEKDLGAA